MVGSVSVGVTIIEKYIITVAARVCSIKKENDSGILASMEALELQDVAVDGYSTIFSAGTRLMKREVYMHTNVKINSMSGRKLQV